MIEYFRGRGQTEDARFSIVVPTWNNLAYLRLCVSSIRRNSAFQHQIIVHVNDGHDGTREWVREQGLDHTASAENVGVCYAVNAAAMLARTEYVVFMNDDMYACPRWDAALWRAIQEIGHDRFLVSATMIEPLPGSAATLSPHDFGRDVETFREDELLAALPGLRREDWNGASWPPNVVHRTLWGLVGGLSTEFFPGFYSDPDLAMKLWQAGVREFRGVGDSLVYHFRQKSTSRVRGKGGRRRFALKHGITSSYLYRHVLQMGRPYRGPLPEMRKGAGYALARLKAWRHSLWPW